jgi:hypothetical protein
LSAHTKTTAVAIDAANGIRAILGAMLKHIAGESDEGADLYVDGLVWELMEPVRLRRVDIFGSIVSRGLTAC